MGLFEGSNHLEFHFSKVDLGVNRKDEKNSKADLEQKLTIFFNGK
jgi:hypothetical protein